MVVRGGEVSHHAGAALGEAMFLRACACFGALSFRHLRLFKVNSPGGLEHEPLRRWPQL